MMMDQMIWMMMITYWLLRIKKYTKKCVGSTYMLKALLYVHNYNGKNVLIIELKWGVKQLIGAIKNRPSLDRLGGIMKKFDEKVEHAVKKLYNDYVNYINMGFGPMTGACGMALLNYATTKEAGRAYKNNKEGNERNLMDPKASECLRMVVQTFARASVNGILVSSGKEPLELSLFCTSIILLDMCFIAFDNKGNKESTYNTKVEKIADNLLFG